MLCAVPHPSREPLSSSLGDGLSLLFGDSTAREGLGVVPPSITIGLDFVGVTLARLEPMFHAHVSHSSLLDIRTVLGSLRRTACCRRRTSNICDL
jgi:hypothetical protein